ncbi:MAG: bifunctional folylpolyglutamate synthase/dihydrofolate synthase [Proteobacteria bacterium]|nr:bifunctional folylpolyglutamate synthase/dihydrofolate synthase [Pseudomonadota bacterium]
MSNQQGPEAGKREIRTAAEAAGYLEGLINFERAPGYASARLSLAPIRALLERLGHPERGLSIVHIAGSKGKGSTALLVEALLGALGERVGTFTSPHLVAWTERFRVAGEPAGDAQLAAAVARVQPHVDACRAATPAEAPTFFDATTAAALCLFREAGVERAVLEVGLGGRLDSTNAVEPAVTCVTSIELEHTDKLGTTLGAIAGEKAGIVKAGAPCVMGPLPPEAAEVVTARAREVGAPLLRWGREFWAQRTPTGRLRFGAEDGTELEVPFAPRGDHHVVNAGLAVAAVRALGAHSETSLRTAAERAFAKVALPGRAEVRGGDAWTVIDSAHTPASARALGAVLDELPTRKGHFVLSISTGKDLDAFLAVLAPHLDSVTLTRADPHRSLDPAELARALTRVGAQVPSRVVPNPHLAIRAAREAQAPGSLLCVTGSVYLAGVARQVLASPPAAGVRVTRRPRGVASDAGG